MICKKRSPCASGPPLLGPMSWEKITEIGSKARRYWVGRSVAFVSAWAEIDAPNHAAVIPSSISQRRRDRRLCMLLSFGVRVKETGIYRILCVCEASRQTVCLDRLRNPRVRGGSSGVDVGLKNVCLFRRHGVKGAKLPCGVWGEPPPKTPIESISTAQPPMV